MENVIEQTNHEAVPVSKRKRKQRFFWGCAVIFLFFVLLLPAGCQYQPPLVGVAGYETHLLTDPGYFGGPVKWWQSLLEMKPCQYEMLGWDADDYFYYEARCDGRQQVWQYNPYTASAQRIGALPIELHHEAVAREMILDYVRADDVSPKEAEPWTRPLYLKGDGLASLGGEYTAVITQRIYSVYDVVIFEEK